MECANLSCSGIKTSVQRQILGLCLVLCVMWRQKRMSYYLHPLFYTQQNVDIYLQFVIYKMWTLCPQLGGVWCVIIFSQKRKYKNINALKLFSLLHDTILREQWVEWNSFLLSFSCSWSCTALLIHWLSQDYRVFLLPYSNPSCDHCEVETTEYILCGSLRKIFRRCLEVPEVLVAEVTRKGFQKFWGHCSG